MDVATFRVDVGIDPYNWNPSRIAGCHVADRCPTQDAYVVLFPSAGDDAQHRTPILRTGLGVATFRVDVGIDPYDWNQSRIGDAMLWIDAQHRTLMLYCFHPQGTISTQDAYVALLPPVGVDAHIDPKRNRMVVHIAAR